MFHVFETNVRNKKERYFKLLGNGLFILLDSKYFWNILFSAAMLSSSYQKPMITKVQMKRKINTSTVILSTNENSVSAAYNLSSEK